MVRELLAATAALVIGASAAHAGGSWEGAYVGLHAGYGWGDVSVKDTTGGVTPGPFDYTARGFLGGASAGYNLQAGITVVGIEADIGYLGLNGRGIIPSSDPAHHQDITLDGGLYGDITGRLGFVRGNALFYGKGGLALYGGEALQKTTKPGFVSHGTGTFTGWTAGGGLEFALTPHTTLKVEYLHFDFGHQGGDQTSVSDDPVGFVYKNTTSLTADTVKLGINYKF